MKTCLTCRYWKFHSLENKAGDCMHETDGIPHRYSRVIMADGSVSHLDSFGPQETGPNDTCGAYDMGCEESPPDPRRP
jgi:hypothetical protein